MDELEQKGHRRVQPQTSARTCATAGAPTQLALFSEPPDVVILQSAAQTERAISEALELGWAVRLRRSEGGFELTLSPPAIAPAAAACGFTRRVGSRLLQTAEASGTRLWARPAGPAWPGWMEWGTLPP